MLSMSSSATSLPTVLLNASKMTFQCGLVLGTTPLSNPLGHSTIRFCWEETKQLIPFLLFFPSCLSHSTQDLSRDSSGNRTLQNELNEILSQ